MMNIGLKYMYILFSCTIGFYEIYEENINMLYLQLCEFKRFYLLKCNKISYWASAHSLLLIIFRCPGLGEK